MAIAAITVMEIRFGIALLPRNQRRTDLDTKFRQFLTQGFAGRAALRSGRRRCLRRHRAHRRHIGSPITTEDGMIAAIARVHGAPVATRDVGGFEGYGLILINPWQS
jgi:toxin FitB